MVVVETLAVLLGLWVCSLQEVQPWLLLSTWCMTVRCPCSEATLVNIAGLVQGTSYASVRVGTHDINTTNSVNDLHGPRTERHRRARLLWGSKMPLAGFCRAQRPINWPGVSRQPSAHVPSAQLEKIRSLFAASRQLVSENPETSRKRRCIVTLVRQLYTAPPEHLVASTRY